MADKAAFKALVDQGYSFRGEHFELGACMLDGEIVDGTAVTIPLQTMNRPGLNAGATGTGKT